MPSGKHFAAQLERADLDAAALTQTFVLELLRDVFGYPMQSCPGVTLGERHYPVSLVAGSVPVVVGPHTLALHEADVRFAIAGSSTRKKSAFMLAQELLNASPDHLWAIACNGKQLRLLHASRAPQAANGKWRTVNGREGLTLEFAGGNGALG